MNAILAPIAAWLRVASNAIGRVALAPLGVLPGWLSATIVAASSGVLLLIVFKHTSNQAAIKRTRDDLDANLLALKLFKDSTRVTLRAQGRLIVGSFRLMSLAMVPMLAMALPVTLLLGQLSLWYQSRPLRVGEEAVVTLALAGNPKDPWPKVRLRPDDAVRVEVGPVRVRSRREACWAIEGRVAGAHRLTFEVDGRPFEKQLAIGEGLMRVSAVRPGWDWGEILSNPAEEPFRPDSPARSISVKFPERSSWSSGTDSWAIYWFIASTVAALAFRPALGVKV